MLRWIERLAQIEYCEIISTHAQLDVDAINAAEERGLPEDNIIVARDSQFARRVANRG